MSSFVITADGPSDWHTVNETPVHLAVATSAVFDGATVALEQDIAGTEEPLLDENDTAITYTAAIDEALLLNVGDRIRFNTSGAGGSTNVPVKLAGAVRDYATG